MPSSNTTPITLYFGNVSVCLLNGKSTQQQTVSCELFSTCGDTKCQAERVDMNCVDYREDRRIEGSDVLVAHLAAATTGGRLLDVIHSERRSAKT